jgi:hypothetical protein
MRYRRIEFAMSELFDQRVVGRAGNMGFEDLMNAAGNLGGDRD